MALCNAMALPMSSFPNVNSLLAEDDYGTPYLVPKDFVKAGLPASMVVGGLVALLAFPLACLLPPVHEHVAAVALNASALGA